MNSQLKTLFVEEMQDLLNAEMQLTKALPQMAEAAHHPKLKEAFEKHLAQTEMHVERLQEAFSMLGESADGKPCKAMAGLVQEGQERIQESSDKDPLAADLALINAAQKVEHYEIAGYGTLRTLARQLGLNEVAMLLNRTQGEEEAADYLLTSIAKPILQAASLEDMGANVNLHSVPQDEAASATATAKRKLSSHSRHPTSK